MGVIELDKNFNITDWNPASEKIFGYSRDEAIGLNEMDILMPESARDCVQSVWNDLFRKKDGNTSINENITKDGRRIFCEWFNTPLMDEDGTLPGYRNY
jgi:PAS domain S-box-containing protein